MALLFVVDASFYHIVAPMALILRPALTFRGPADARKSEVRKEVPRLRRFCLWLMLHSTILSRLWR